MKEAYLGKPGELKMLIKAGAIVTVSILVKAAGVPVNWTGYTFISQVRKSTSESKTNTVLAEIDVVHESDPTTGVLLATVDATTLKEGAYVFDVQATIGVEKPFILEGILEVEGSVTRG